MYLQLLFQLDNGHGTRVYLAYEHRRDDDCADEEDIQKDVLLQRCSSFVDTPCPLGHNHIVIVLVVEDVIGESYIMVRLTNVAMHEELL